MGQWNARGRRGEHDRYIFVYISVQFTKESGSSSRVRIASNLMPRVWGSKKKWNPRAGAQASESRDRRVPPRLEDFTAKHFQIDQYSCESSVIVRQSSFNRQSRNWKNSSFVTIFFFFFTTHILRAGRSSLATHRWTRREQIKLYRFYDLGRSYRYTVPIIYYKEEKNGNIPSTAMKLIDD